MITYFRGRLDRVRREELSRGASAVEWVVISAIVVGIVVAIGFTIKGALSGKADSVKNCIDGANGDSGSC
ncbi:Flp family type IVb pilin [Streptomyces polygonati]|uniref:Flp family type IVb pilin n=1 Tax=Streptomyces polygonati TaxID=1617087 RepID=A0ABV8HNQ7_9ACTN